MGKKIASEDMAITLLSQLPTEYSNFYSSLITSGRLNEVTWEELVPMVLDQEERFQQQAQSMSPEALAGGRSPARSEDVGPQQSRPQKTKEEREALKAQRHCNNCGEKGHYWRQCPKREESSTSSNVMVQRFPAYVHLEVLNDEPSPLIATAETILTSCDSREWLLDSGASKHMTPITDDMTDLRPHLGTVCIGDNSSIPIHSEGSLDVLPDGNGGFVSSKVYHVPQLGYHLLSVSELCHLGMKVVFEKYTVSIQDQLTGKEIRGGSLEHGVYKLHGLSSAKSSAHVKSSAKHEVFPLHGMSPAESGATILQSQFLVPVPPVPDAASKTQLVDSTVDVVFPTAVLTHSSSHGLAPQPGAERGC